MRIGYFLSSEEYTPQQLVEQAVLAEQAGFEALWISDHFHPWNDEQGQSPFVWGVIGAISQACRLPVTTAVTAPTVRMHPAIVAQAAATAAVQLEGRFTLGVGTGEALNEHVLGDRWPTEDVRLEMLEEAVEVIRELWQRRVHLPPRPALHGRERAHLHPAGRAAEGVRQRVRAEVLRPRAAHRRRLHHHPAGRRAGPEWKAKAGADKPTQAGYKVCVAATEDEGVQIAHRLWANAGLPGELSPGPAVAQALRAGQRAGHRGHDPRVHRVRRATSTGTSRPSRRSPTPASTTSTSPTWGRTTATSSRCTATRCSRGCADRRPVVGSRVCGSPFSVPAWPAAPWPRPCRPRARPSWSAPGTSRTPWRGPTRRRTPSGPRPTPTSRLVPRTPTPASHAEVLVNATSGAGSLAALEAAAVADGTVVLDVSNPLDFSAGLPADPLGRQHRQRRRAAAARVPRGAGGQDAEHRELRGDGRAGAGPGGAPRLRRRARTTTRSGSPSSCSASSAGRRTG